VGFEGELIVAAVVLGEKRGDGWGSFGGDDEDVAAPRSLRTPFMGSEQRCCGCLGRWWWSWSGNSWRAADRLDQKGQTNS